MSKYLFASLSLVFLIVGLMLGFFLYPRLGMESDRDVGASKLSETMQKEPEDDDQLYSDQIFLRDMIAHHEDAISMSKNVLQHTSRKEVRTMAIAIIEVQSKEIEQMKQWLEEWE